MSQVISVNGHSFQMDYCMESYPCRYGVTVDNEENMCFSEPGWDDLVKLAEYSKDHGLISDDVEVWLGELEKSMRDTLNSLL